MFQVEDHFVHGDVPLEQHPVRIVQNKTGHQPQHQVAIIGVFTLDLTGIGGEQMLQGPEDLLNQISTRPNAQQACGGNPGGQAEQIATILASFVDQD